MRSTNCSPSPGGERPRRGVTQLPAGGGRVTSRQRHYLRIALIGAGDACWRRRRMLRAGRLHRHRSARPARPGSAQPALDHRPRPSRPPAARLHDARRTLAPSGRSQLTSTSATSPCSWHSRTSASTSTAASTCARSRGPRCSSSRTAASSPAARRSPCRWRVSSRATTSAPAVRRCARSSARCGSSII